MTHAPDPLNLRRLRRGLGRGRRDCPRRRHRGFGIAAQTGAATTAAGTTNGSSHRQSSTGVTAGSTSTTSHATSSV